MPISDAVIKNVKYGLEKIPDSWFGNIPAGAEVANPLLDLKRFFPFIVQLTDVQLISNALVEFRARYNPGNAARVQENTAAMLSGFPAAWKMVSKDQLYFNFFGTAAVANFSTHYGLWVIKPTVAHKVLYGMPLDSKEAAIDAELGISNTVEKGLLPWDVSYQIEREYQILGEETHARTVNIAAPNVIFPIENLYPKPGEFLVLTRIASAPGAAAQNVVLHVDRDLNVDQVQVATFPLSLLPGGEVSCFLPAVNELKIYATASVAPGAMLVRYTYQRVKMTNLLRIRFGLMNEAEAPADLYNKVLGGVL